MGFSAKQMQALRRNLDQRYVRSREVNGRELSYIGGWYAISEANRIFGFDGWNRETIESKCVLTRENRGAFLAVYIARVRITVSVGGSTIIREGHGTGEGRAATPGEVHDTALKGAETDATKRALATFGKPFGLSLYEHGKLPAPFRAATATPSRVETGRAVNFARDDTTPIPRPSTYHGRQRYLETRELPPHNLLARPGLKSGLKSESKSELTTEDNSEPRPDLKSASQSEHRPPLEPEHPTPAADVFIVPDTEDLALKDLAPEALAPGRIDKSALTISEPKRRRDKAHLRYVATQPCLVCGRQPCDPHHLRFAQPRALGLKVSDEFTVPLCRGHHRQLHQVGNEAAWWGSLKIEALEIAKGLWDQTHAIPIRRNENRAFTNEKG